MEWERRRFKRIAGLLKLSFSVNLAAAYEPGEGAISGTLITRNKTSPVFEWVFTIKRLGVGAATTQELKDKYYTSNYKHPFTGPGQGCKHWTRDAVPVKPTLERVLWSLIREAECSDMRFGEWCQELGYDGDSRRVYRIWESMRDSAAELRRVFSARELELLSAHYEGY